MLGHLTNKNSCEEIKRRLGEFVSREGKDLYRALLDKQVTFVDLLVAFPLLKPPVSVLSYLKRLQRRWYSIANWIDYSSADVDSRALRIAFTEVSMPRAGLMTNQLARIIDNLNEHEIPSLPFYPSRDRIILECRDPPPNMFRLDENKDIPILMIAAGSGIAPFIGFLDRIGNLSGKEATLIFGCRDEHSFIYKEALQKKVEEGSLKKLHVAMSREGNKKYVQDVLLGTLIISKKS
jgi:sulfite reductase alpha subunit-like flavoprotein